jgi:ribokinase
VREVIITLAEQGCLHRSREKSKWYAAYEESGLIPVDTSGASDAFISALAFSLAEGNCMETAILYAQVAASLSICQNGVQASLPDRGMMELRKSYYQPR